MSRLPQKKIILPHSDKQLLLLCKVQSFRASGSGGQHINKTDSAVRLVYLPHNIVVISQNERSQHLNKRHCLKKLREKIARLNDRPPKRIPTKIPKGKKENAFYRKMRHGEKKKMRRKIERPDT